MVRCLLAVWLLLSVAANAAEIKGTVTNASGGERLGRVQISILPAEITTTTAGDGSFSLQNIPAGSYTLRLNAVGYRLLTIPFSLASAADVKEFAIALAPDNFRRIDHVQVTADIFQHEDSASVSEMNLTSSEVKDASTVLADDPFRAIQSLPGVSASGNNELFAEFSVMGAPFENVGVYLDDVLIPGPFHGLPNVQNGASLSLLTSETVEEIKLLPVAYPEKYGDAIGAALSIRTRDGSRTSPLFRFSGGMGDSDLLGEGQLGREKQGSWLASARKSYLGYLVRNRVGSEFADFSFYDADLKLAYDITSSQNVNFYALGGAHRCERYEPQSGQSKERLKRFRNREVGLAMGYHTSSVARQPLGFHPSAGRGTRPRRQRDYPQLI